MYTTSDSRTYSLSDNKNSGMGMATKRNANSADVMWWMAMLTAVLAIPAMASLIVIVLQPSGAGAVAMFVLSCWACVYAGIKLVKNPRITFPYMLEQISFTAEDKMRYTQIIQTLTNDMQEWKRCYDRCDIAFMGLSKQPVWSHLDELTAILNNVRQSIGSDSTVNFDDIKKLNQWLLSGKPGLMDAYMQALRGVYHYGQANASLSGNDLNAMFPELEKGLLVKFEQTPMRTKAFAWEFLSEIRKTYPFVSAQLNSVAEAAEESKIKLVQTRAA